MIVMSIVEPVDGEDCLRLVNDVFIFLKWYLILPDHIGHSWGTSSAQVSPSLGPWSPLVSRNQQCTAQHEGLTRSYYHKVSYHKVASWMLMMMMINHEKWCILQFSSHRTWAWNIPQGWFFLHVPISRGDVWLPCRRWSSGKPCGGSKTVGFSQGFYGRPVMPWALRIWTAGVLYGFVPWPVVSSDSRKE